MRERRREGGEGIKRRDIEIIASIRQRVPKIAERRERDLDVRVDEGNACWCKKR